MKIPWTIFNQPNNFNEHKINVLIVSLYVFRSFYPFIIYVLYTLKSGYKISIKKRKKNKSHFV